jgi:D-alanine-D-alanine ligase
VLLATSLIEYAKPVARHFFCISVPRPHSAAVLFILANHEGRLKITLLANLESPEAKPDVVVGQISEALTSLKHEVKVLATFDDIDFIVSELKRHRPDLVFNLFESFGNEVIGGQMGVTGLLDLLELPHTGGGAGELYLQEDKALAKKLLAYEQILYPDFAIFAPNSEFETGGKLRMPLFVKPLRMDASIGIDEKSLVRNTGELMERVVKIHKDLGDAALAEEYIEGREIYVGVLGNLDPVALPPVEIDFSGLPDGSLKVMDSQAKFDTKSERYQGTRAVVAELDPALRAKLQKVTLDAYRALRVRDYGRLDLRLTESGEIYVIEVNASCYLEQQGEFVMAAAAAGMEYPQLIGRIVDLAIERWKQRKTASHTVGNTSRGKRPSRKKRKLATG